METSLHSSMGKRFREQFAQDGAVMLPGFLDKNDLDECRAVFDVCVQNPTRRAMVLKNEAGEKVGILDVGNRALRGRLEKLVAAIPFGTFFADLWDSRNVWFYAEGLFQKTGGVVPRSAWHQDTTYMPVSGEHWANVWISFEAVPKSHALEIVKGSHRGAQYGGAIFNPDNAVQPERAAAVLPDFPDIDAVLAKDPTAYDIISWATNPGDVVVMNSKCLHGGAGVDADFPDRHTLVLRFFGDDARLRFLSSPEAGGISPRGILFGDDLVHLSDGDLFRAPVFKKLH